MFVLRPAAEFDADQIFEVARHLDTVNLPADTAHLHNIIRHSIASFGQSLPPLEREYLFVLEDTETKKVVGTSVIHAQHGTKRAPHVFFHVRKDERYSESLDQYFVHQCLLIGYNYNGPTEIGGLILLPQYRGNALALGKQLSYTRFLFIAMTRANFRDQVLSELLPPLEDNGTSILWEHLGRRFTGLSYQEADLLSKTNKEFIRSLFPHVLIYTALLPDQVQAVIGKVGPSTRGVEKMLRRIGFQYAQQIDPFDGGPHFVANTDNISLVNNARMGAVDIVEQTDESYADALVAMQPDDQTHFRAIRTAIRWNEDTSTISLSKLDSEYLHAKSGKIAWAVAL